jgi:N-dimethylarginine dimethylaminohydrolase
MAILMCRPEYFGVEYEINPWMHVEVSVDHASAQRQWDALYRTYGDMGLEVELAEPRRGLPDMVFTANAAVLWKGKAVLSNFHHRERQGEEPHWRAALERLGFVVSELPPTVAFEGAGDALFVGERLFCAHGFRSDPEAAELVGSLLDVEVVPVQLVDPRFYHLDTCFCPLDDRTVMVAPDALDEQSAALIRQTVERVVEVPIDVAAGFACNALPVDSCVVSSLAALRLEPRLAEQGFGVIGLEMGEFMKSGGGVRCLSLPLDAGRR